MLPHHTRKIAKSQVWTSSPPFSILRISLTSQGSWIFDFWAGVELNPRLGALDLKFFHNGRPGIVAWTLMYGIRRPNEFSLLIAVQQRLLDGIPISSNRGHLLFNYGPELAPGSLRSRFLLQ